MDVDTTTSAGLTIPLAHTSTSIPPVISCSSSPNNLPASQNLQRDEQLWYPDGNIILIAREIEFRLYQGPLMEHSRVFQDMLTMPQPPPSDTQPSSAASPACVTIHLDDSPEDLRHFLRVFVGKSFLYVHPPSLRHSSAAAYANNPPPTHSYGGFHPAYHEISACIRLADKYECTMLMQRSLEYLKRYFHDNFDAWKDDAAVFAPPKFERPHCIGVVNLARLTGQDKMLPGALMACCQLGAEIADGFPREDGSPDGARETLSAADLARCFVGRAKLLEWNARATLRILHQEVHAECRQREQCGAVLLRMLRALEDSSVLYSLRWDWSWMPWLDKEDPERELCGACYGMLGKNGRQKEQQRIIFDQLPALMQVEVKHWGKTDEEIARIEAEEAEAAAAAAAAAAASGDQGQDQMNTHGVVNDNDDDDEDSSDNEDSDSDEESDGSDA
ncbi:hypothetical protein GSI_11916 [Ganoderma sinense ZZ0214-1]|uniref:BTB domain-containing protein n=1 Tax=Ganoderma sinense ZZ0214-1 TaxID=1077348 RepID=A0A2G8RXB9_9APHY|nr:hypothetical protein GSI_11916 [Ganoderma sinense ZZ0214-1]